MQQPEIGVQEAQIRSLGREIALQPKKLGSDLPAFGFAGLAVSSPLSMVGFFEFSVWFRHDFTGFRRSDWVVDGGSVHGPKGRGIEGCVRIAGNPGDGK